MDSDSVVSILVVDDDAITRFIHKTLIQSFDLKIFYYEASNGKEALNVIDTIDERIPNIILLDIDMPLMDGFDFIEAFQKLSYKEATEIVMVSSSQNPIDINRCIVLGIKRFVPKPITRICLESIISEMIVNHTQTSKFDCENEKR